MNQQQKAEAEKTAQIAGAVPIVIAGMPAIYFEIPEELAPLGSEIALTRPGELAPFLKGHMAKGATVLVIPPEVAAHLRSQISSQLAAAARQAGVGGAGPRVH